MQTDEMNFICEKCGKVKPNKIYYTYPTQGDCPKCGALLTNSSQNIHCLSEEEANKRRAKLE